MPLNKKIKLQKLLSTLAPFDDGVDKTFSVIDKEFADISARLKETISAKTLEQVNDEFKKLRKLFEPLLPALEKLKQGISERDKKLITHIQEKINSITTVIGDVTQSMKDEAKEREESVQELRDSIRVVSERKMPDFGPQIENTKSELTRLITQLEKEVKDKRDILEIEKNVESIKDGLDRLRNNVENHRAGGAERNLTIDGSIISRNYRDVNFASTLSIAWVATTDHVNKRVNLQASIRSGGGGAGTPGGNTTEIQYNSGGSFAGDPAFTIASSVVTVGQPGSVRGALDLAGATAQTVRLQVPSIAGNWALTLPVNDGSAGQYLLTDGNGITQWASVTAAGGSGITRSVSVITANTTGGDTSSTDYVYFASATGMTFTLPTAIGNSNLYTIKNFTASSVRVATTDGETIDQSAIALMSSMNESLSFMSNNSVWGVV